MNNIIMYSLETCPKCNVLGKLLDKNNIKYEKVIDLEFLKSNGFTSTPILKIGDKFMEFSEAVDWIKNRKD